MDRFFDSRSQHKGTFAELVAIPCTIDGIHWKPKTVTLCKEYLGWMFWYFGCFNLYSKHLLTHIAKLNTQPETSYHSPPLYPQYYLFGRVHNDTRMIGSCVYSNNKLIGILHENYDERAIFCKVESIRHCIENLPTN